MTTTYHYNRVVDVRWGISIDLAKVDEIWYSRYKIHSDEKRDTIHYDAEQVHTKHII